MSVGPRQNTDLSDIEQRVSDIKALEWMGMEIPDIKELHDLSDDIEILAKDFKKNNWDRYTEELKSLKDILDRLIKKKNETNKSNLDKEKITEKKEKSNNDKLSTEKIKDMSTEEITKYFNFLLKNNKLDKNHVIEVFSQNNENLEKKEDIFVQVYVRLKELEGGSNIEKESYLKIYNFFREATYDSFKRNQNISIWTSYIFLKYLNNNNNLNYEYMEKHFWRDIFSKILKSFKIDKYPIDIFMYEGPNVERILFSITEYAHQAMNISKYLEEKNNEVFLKSPHREYIINIEDKERIKDILNFYKQKNKKINLYELPRQFQEDFIFDESVSIGNINKEKELRANLFSISPDYITNNSPKIINKIIEKIRSEDINSEWVGVEIFLLNLIEREIINTDEIDIILTGILKKENPHLSETEIKDKISNIIKDPYLKIYLKIDKYIDNHEPEQIREKLDYIKQKIEEWKIDELSKNDINYLIEVFLTKRDETGSMWSAWLIVDIIKQSDKDFLQNHFPQLLKLPTRDEDYVIIIIKKFPKNIPLLNPNFFKNEEVMKTFLEHQWDDINLIVDILSWMTEKLNEKWTNSTSNAIMQTIEYLLDKNWGENKNIGEILKIFFENTRLENYIIKAIKDKNKVDEKYHITFFKVEYVILSNYDIMLFHKDFLDRLITVNTEQELDAEDLNMIINNIPNKITSLYDEETINEIKESIRKNAKLQEAIKNKDFKAFSSILYVGIWENVSDKEKIKEIHKIIIEALLDQEREKLKIMEEVFPIKTVKSQQKEKFIKIVNWKEELNSDSYKNIYNNFLEENKSKLKWLSEKEKKAKSIELRIEFINLYHDVNKDSEEFQKIMEYLEGIEGVIEVENINDNHNEFINWIESWWVWDFNDYLEKQQNSPLQTTTQPKESISNSYFPDVPEYNPISWTYSLENKTLSFSQDEISQINKNKENLNRILNFYKILDGLWLNSIWWNRKEIFKWLSAVKHEFKPYDDNYLQEHEVKMFLDAILISTWTAPSWVINSDSLNLEQYIVEYKKFENTNISGSIKKDADSLDRSKMEAKFMNEFFPQWSFRFDLEKFIKAYNSKWESLERKS